MIQGPQPVGSFSLREEETNIRSMDRNPHDAVRYRATIAASSLKVAESRTIAYQPGGKVRRPAGPRPSGASIADWITLVPGANPAADSVPTGRDRTVRGPRPVNPSPER